MRAELDVLPYHFLDAHIVIQSAHAVGHAVEGHLGGVGDIGEDGIGNVVINSLQNGGRQLLTQPFALLIDVAVGASAEVDALEATCAEFAGRHNLFQLHLTVLVDDERLSCLKLANVLSLQIEGGL